MTKKNLNAFLMVIIALIGVIYLTTVTGDLHAFHGLGKLVSYFSWPLLLVGISRLALLENRKPGDIFDCYLLVSTILAVIGFLITLQVITVRPPFQFAMGNWWDAISAGALGNEGNLHTPLGDVWTKYPIGWFLMMTPIAMKLAQYMHQKIADRRLLIIIAIVLMIAPQYISEIIDLPFSLNAALLGTGLLVINDSIIVKSTKIRMIWIVIGSMVTIIAAKMSGVYFSYGRAENIFISVFGLIAAIKLIEFLLDFMTIHVKWNMSKKNFFYTTVGFLFILTLVVNLTIFLN
ncbi:fucose 4-O-acetylase [Leuconostoc mesenteroides]